MTDQVKPPKPLACGIEGTVKTTTFDLDEIRAFAENTSEEVIDVTTDDGKKSFVLVEWVRRALRGSKANPRG
jgi:hypothetical protein